MICFFLVKRMSTFARRPSDGPNALVVLGPLAMQPQKRTDAASMPNLSRQNPDKKDIHLRLHVRVSLGCSINGPREFLHHPCPDYMHPAIQAKKIGLYTAILWFIFPNHFMVYFQGNQFIFYFRLYMCTCCTTCKTFEYEPQKQ